MKSLQNQRSLFNPIAVMREGWSNWSAERVTKILYSYSSHIGVARGCAGCDGAAGGGYGCL